MKIRIILKSLFFIVILLVPVAFAGTVNRTITYNDVYYNSTIIYKTANITLIPTPYTDFDTPGYFVTEYLPNGVVLVSTDADQYKLTENSLLMLRFNPSSNNLQTTYTIKIPKDNGVYTIYGTFLDKNRNYGEIKAQTITVQNNNQNTQEAVSTSTFGTYTPSIQEQGEPVKVDSVKITKITAQQAQADTLLRQRSDSPLFFIGLIITVVFIIIGLLIYKKIKKMPVTYEFVD